LHSSFDRFLKSKIGQNDQESPKTWSRANNASWTQTYGIPRKSEGPHRLLNVYFYISPQYGQFSGENIILGSRGDRNYEYLIKIWLQQQGAGQQTKVIEAFRHNWTGYKNYAMGSDELMPLRKRGVDWVVLVLLLKFLRYNYDHGS
jgi:hypothetical protein